MNNIKSLISVLAGVVVSVAVSTTYIMKHPDQENIKSVQSSWLSKEEKEGAIKRIVALGCDNTFRKAFIPGTSVVPTGLINQFNEQTEAYQYISDVTIIYNNTSYNGGYICTYYKNGHEPLLNVSMDGGVRSILKK